MVELTQCSEHEVHNVVSHGVKAAGQLIEEPVLAKEVSELAYERLIGEYLYSAQGVVQDGFGEATVKQRLPATGSGAASYKLTL